MSTNLIPNAFIRWHFSTLNQQPELIKFLRAELSIPEQVFQRDGYVLSAEQYGKLLSLTISQSDDESFGTLLRPLRQGSFHLMAYACISCTNLQQVIERYMKFYCLMNDQIHWRLLTTEKQCQLIFDLDKEPDVDYSYFNVFNCSIIWRWLSWMIDKPITLDAVSFNFSSPVSSNELKKVFNQKVEYDQQHNQLNFANNYLSMPVKQTAQSLRLFLNTVPECFLSHYQEEISLTKQLNDYLQAQENVNQVTLVQAASYFCCSEQTLIRALRTEGSRFISLREKIQKERAHQLLIKTSLSNQEISQKLGFSEPSVFYRSIKKWFGKTPSQYRESLK